MGALNSDPGCQEASSSFLSMPPEVRNQIYHQLFSSPVYRKREDCKPMPVLYLADFGKPAHYPAKPSVTENQSAIVGACRQLYEETQLLYLGTTVFHLIGAAADPAIFADRTAHLPLQRRKAIRHIVLTARISHLRALNETWDSLPFGHSDIFLDTLTLVPHRPEMHAGAYAEVADLSQCHTLAYVLTETLKSLRNVGTVVVRNEGCFNAIIWRLSYRSLVFRLWKWGGRLCDLKFKENGDEEVFSVRCASSRCEMGGPFGGRKESEVGWMDAQQELHRLLGMDEGRRGMEEPTA